MTNFARSLYATTSRHVAMGVALAVIGTAPAFAQDYAAEASAAAAATSQDAPSDANPNTGPAEEQAATEGGDIVVTGIRSSIANSVNQKKNNTSLVEVISAEDIGKLPDVSIAESLSRLPGLATQRLDGRANVISIRGLAPDFTTTLLNGREQVSAGNNRGVELDQYPSELINGAIVYKTPDASLIGQALGGTIDMRTIRPLEHGKRTITFGLRGEVNDLGKINPDISNKGYRGYASYIDQNEDDTIGWGIVVAKMSSPTAEKRYQAWGYPTTGAGEFVLGGLKPYIKSNKLDRTGVMGVLEFKPNDQWHVTLDGYWSKFKEDQRLRGLELPFWWGGQGETLQPGYTVEDGLVTEGTWTNIKAVLRNDIVHRDSNILAGGLNVAFDPSDRLRIEGDASFSRLRKTEENIEIYAGTGRGAALGARDTMGFTVDDEGRFVFDPTLDYADPTLFQLTDPRGWCGRPGFPGDCQDGFINAPKVKDQLASLRLQATMDVAENDSIRAGVNFTRRKKSLQDRGFVLTHENYPASTMVPQDLLYDPVSLGFVGIDEMLAFDSWEYFQQGHYTISDASAWDTGRLSNSWEVTEKVLTGYLQYNVNRDLGSVPIRGNAGVQVVRTDQEGESVQVGVGEVVPITDGDTYTKVLPSLNLSFEVMRNNFIRVSAARVLARARMDQMNPGGGFNFDISKNIPGANLGNSPWSGTVGNAKLRPLIADTVDVAFESYFAPSAYVAVSAFYKDLKSFIYRQTDVFDFTGYPTQGGVTPTFNLGEVSQWLNTGGGKIKGFEVSSSLPFRVLTPALDGFGVLLSGSYTKSSVRLGSDAPKTVMPGLSKWVVNSTAYFEKHGFQARVSGRYRSKFLAEVSGLSLAREYDQAKSEFIVDAQIGYEFQKGALKGLSILATGYNLTNEPFVTYRDSDPTHIRDYQDYGRNYMLGFSYRF
ncbi:MAG: TonB-dependent receptor [Pseudomonadota bacterium]|nr:TonB-dependent receptor [Pseudomonadota bacterium]